MSRTPEARLRRALDYLERGLPVPARAQLEALQASAPAHACTRWLAAEIAWREDRVRASATAARDAAAALGADPALGCDVVAALLRVGETAAARECLARPVFEAALGPAESTRVADFRLGLGDYDGALAALDRALAGADDSAAAHFYRGRVLTFLGRGVDAEAAYLRALQLAPTFGEAALALVTLGPRLDPDGQLAIVADGLRRVSRGTRDHAAFQLARYRLLEDRGQYGDAWAALADGNAIMAARTRDNAQRQEAGLRRTIDHFAAHPAPTPGATQPGPRPIFIVGLPRSGTTVLERLLANHPDVAGVGELFDFGRQLQWAANHRSLQDDTFFARLAGIDPGDLGRRYLAQTQWRARGARYFVDKQTSNWMLVGPIQAALPGARILHVVRDPMDTCFSIYRAMFGDAYAIGNDLTTLARHYRQYRTLMARWHELVPHAILDVSYDDLVRTPEANMRAVLAFCGLPWDPACIDLVRNRTPVATMSATEVRRPLAARSAGIWRRYAARLDGLHAALAGT